MSSEVRRIRVFGPLVLLAAAVCGMAGCLGRGAVQMGRVPEVERREATREELLRILEQQMNRLATLTAKATVSAIKQDILVPASIPDDVNRMRGKPYRKKFGQAEINGQLLLSRGPDGSRKVRFQGDVIGVSGSFMMLAKDNEFWVVLPNTERSKDPKDTTRGVVYTGTVENETARPRQVFSVRPQDVLNLLLTDEVYAVTNANSVCYVETWPDYYVLHFLRIDWPEHIYSKVWIEREQLNVAIHQLYDASGEVIAEGRFGNYRPYAGKDSKLTVYIPTEIDFLWPRDKLVMQITLSNIKVNTEIASKVFEPVLPRDYKVERVPTGSPKK